MSRQGGLFDDRKPDSHGLEWQHAKSLSLYYPDAADSHGYYFERNVWRLLERSPYWESIQKSELEAALWLVAITQLYNEFTNYAIDEMNEFSVRDILDDEFDVGEEKLAEHLLGYGSDNVEAFRFPSFDTVSPYDALFDRLATLKSRVRSLVKEVVGAPELRLNFYRDPMAWDDRLRGVALPKPEAQRPLELTNSWGEVMRFVERGKQLPPLPPLPDWLEQGWPGILVHDHDKQFAANVWHLLRRSKLASKLTDGREEAVLWALMLRLSYGGFLEIAVEEWDDRSILMWLEGFGTSRSVMASYLRVKGLLPGDEADSDEEDSEALENALWIATRERAALLKAQLKEALSTPIRIIDFYCDPFGFRDVLAGGEFPDGDQRDHKERALEPDRLADLYIWVDDLFVSSTSLSAD